MGVASESAALAASTTDTRGDSAACARVGFSSVASARPPASPPPPLSRDTSTASSSELETPFASSGADLPMDFPGPLSAHSPASSAASLTIDRQRAELPLPVPPSDRTELQRASAGDALGPAVGPGRGLCRVLRGLASTRTSCRPASFAMSESGKRIIPFLNGVICRHGAPHGSYRGGRGYVCAKTYYVCDRADPRPNDNSPASV
jgi:hypothetical protein